MVPNPTAAQVLEAGHNLATDLHDLNLPATPMIAVRLGSKTHDQPYYLSVDLEQIKIGTTRGEALAAIEHIRLGVKLATITVE